MGFRVLWFGVRVWGSGFCGLGSGFKVWGLGFYGLGLGFRVWGLGLGPGFWPLGAQRAQYLLIKAYTLNHNTKPP